jgi:hypothetical protein
MTVHLSLGAHRLSTTGGSGSPLFLCNEKKVEMPGVRGTLPRPTPLPGISDFGLVHRQHCPWQGLFIHDLNYFQRSSWATPPRSSGNSGCLLFFGNEKKVSRARDKVPVTHLLHSNLSILCLKNRSARNPFTNLIVSLTSATCRQP